jgi:hypothetical protein
MKNKPTEGMCILFGVIQERAVLPYSGSKLTNEERTNHERPVPIEAAAASGVVEKPMSTYMQSSESSDVTASSRKIEQPPTT